MIPRRDISRLSRLSVCIFPWLLAAPPAHAVKNVGDEPIHINARSIEADQKTGVTVYRGSVLVEQGRLSIEADRVEIRALHRRTDIIHATGKPVKLRQGPDATSEEIRAEANRVDYRVSDGKLDMAGDVTLRHGEDLFTGGVLHYDLNSNSLSASGDDATDGRVHAVIQPRKETAGPPSRKNP